MFGLFLTATRKDLLLDDDYDTTFYISNLLHHSPRCAGGREGGRQVELMH